VTHQVDIRGLSLAEIESAVAAIGERPYRARQIANWIHKRHVGSFDAMTNIPVELREYLIDNFKIGGGEISRTAKAPDGTRKILVRLGDGEEIETVIIASYDRMTLCLSTQVGCAMACEFCATARMGLHRNMTAAEIIGQIHCARSALEAGEEITNYVFMGMGEPLANYPNLIRALEIMTSEWAMNISPRRITVSTVGLVPALERLAATIPVNIAVSIHAASDDLRDRLVPINKRYPLAELIAACARLPIKRRARITFEYVMIAGVNDRPEDAAQLARLLNPVAAKVNLIFFNPFDGCDLARSSREAVGLFQAVLRQANLTATIRESRGLEISAACGQLYAASHPAREDGVGA
jgi:23S rRNA (adenine2503-C2)-methyltransferase